jgi:hypothetical protein
VGALFFLWIVAGRPHRAAPTKTAADTPPSSPESGEEGRAVFMGSDEGFHTPKYRASGCLGAPLPVKALLDAAWVRRAAVQALEVQGDPAIQELKEAAKAEGIIRGIAESILEVLEARGITVSPTQRQEILGCSDLDLLKRWLREATLPTTTEAARD